MTTSFFKTPILLTDYRAAEMKSWKQKFNNADFGAQKADKPDKDPSLIQWAGGLHQRGDFNKKRD